MRVPEDFKQSVAFFGTRKDNGTCSANATGFFVAVEPDHAYLVTARHVAENFPENTYVMRLNPQPYLRALEGYEYTDMDMKTVRRWYTDPDDSTVDIVVAPLASLSPHLLAQKTIPERMFFLHTSQQAITYTPDEALMALPRSTFPCLFIDMFPFSSVLPILPVVPFTLSLSTLPHLHGR